MAAWALSVECAVIGCDVTCGSGCVHIGKVGVAMHVLKGVVARGTLLF